MKKLLLIVTILSFSVSFAQGGLSLSRENANEKGMTPIWPGCKTNNNPISCFDGKLRKHIITHFYYPQESIDRAAEGTVTVDFVIDKMGKIKVIAAEGVEDRFLIQEAVRIIRAMPEMDPAKWGSRPIGVDYSIPITFTLPK